MISEKETAYEIDSISGLDPRAQLYNRLRQLKSTEIERAEQLSLFNTISEQISHLYINPSQQNATAIATEMMRWIYFGEENDPLPAGLVKIMDDETNTTEVGIDERIIDRNDFVTTQSNFRVSGDEKLSEALYDEDIYSETIDTEIDGLIKQTDGYQFIMSFAATPPRPPSMRPLSSHERIARESQIDTEVRHRYNIDPRENLPARSPADLALRRAFYHLDEEKVRGLQQDGHTEPLEKMRRYFQPLLIEKLKEEIKKKTGKDEEISGVVFSSNFAGYISDKADEEAYPSPPYLDGPGYLEDWYQTLRQPGAHNLKSLENCFVESILEDVFNPEAEMTSIKEYVDNALYSTRRYIYDLLGERVDNYRDDYAFEALTRHAFMRQASGNPILRSEYEQQPKTSAKLSKDKILLLSEQEIHRGEAIPIGAVKRYTTAKSSPARLIQEMSRPSDLPHDASKTQLLIKFEPSAFEKSAPFIPGYVAISHDPTKNQWGFREDPEGDPYATAEVLIPQGKLEELTTTYEAIGLRNLTINLREMPNATVIDLVEAIRSNTTYTVPDKMVERYSHPNSLSGFKYDIKNGRLQLQCTGSAKFLQLSLEALYGKCAGLQEGYVLSNWDKKINAVGHRQVTFEHDGQTYILDATGRAGGRGHGITANFIDRSSHRPNPRQAPRMTTIVTPHLPDIPPAEAPNLSSQQIEKVRSNFEKQLLNTFDFQTVKQLYDYLAPLPEHDPLRRAMSILMNSNTSDEALQNTATYLELAMAADEDTLRKVGLLPYKDSETLEMAHSSVVAAQRAQSHR
jgi:hypothetical protein